jgi:hypothetical protein
MSRQTTSGDEWPTILWIAWTAEGVERREALCRDHRREIFERYPASARGEGRRGDRCGLCGRPVEGASAIGLGDRNVPQVRPGASHR